MKFLSVLLVLSKLCLARDPEEYRVRNYANYFPDHTKYKIYKNVHHNPGYIRRQVEYLRADTPQREPPDFSKLQFQPLENFQNNAIPTTWRKYPWIARVVHSRSTTYPLAGTASCIKPRVFITAARSIATLKIAHTVVIYQDHRLTVQAFVLPSVRSQQMFEDVGLVVVEDGIFVGNWSAIAVFDKPRTDNAYLWFDDAVGSEQYIAVAYAYPQNARKNPLFIGEYSLHELPVILSTDICQRVYGKRLIPGFYLPCYHYCIFEDFRSEKPQCKNYLGTEGGAVINPKSNRLIGVASWGVVSEVALLPVGLAVPNTDTFVKDLDCALKIRNAKTVPSKGFQQLCD